MKGFLSGIMILLTALTAISDNDEFVKDSIKQYSLDEIKIISPKYNSDIFDLPVAATMIPARLVENNKIESLTDVSGYIPNLFMPDYGSKLTSPIYIRGVGNRINTPSVALYVDGIPYFEKSAFNFDFYDIDRIEVLRGPQGTLYGRNAMGGLINILTENPGKKRKSQLQADYGSNNQINASLGHIQPIGDKLSLSANLNYRHSDGFFENQQTGTYADWINSISGRFKAMYRPSSNFKALFSLQYEDSRQNGYPYAIHNDSSMTVADVNYDYESSYNRKMLSSGLNLTYSGKGYEIRSMSSMQNINDDQIIDQDFTPASIVMADQKQDISMFAQELNIQSTNNSPYQWIVGAFGFYQTLDKEVKVTYGDDGIAMFRLPFDNYHYIKQYNNSNSGIAFFHQSELNVGDFTFTAGIRFDNEKAVLDYEFDKYVNGNESHADDFISELKFSEILPKFAIKYHINQHFTPYATVTKGYNSGGFNSTFERDEDRSFDPETSWNYEAGVKAKWLEQRIYANLALFYIDWDNQQIYQTVPSGAGSMLTNAGKSVSKGVEFEIKAIPADQLETWLVVGYNDAKFVEYIKNETTDYSENYLPYVPKFSFNTGFNYTFEINKNWCDNIVWHTTYQGFGKHFWKETNTAYQGYYGILNQRISFAKDKLIFSLWGKNILNETYNAFYFQALGKSYAQQGKPIQAGLAIRYSF